MVAQLSPKVGEIVKGTFTMQNEMGKLGLDREKFNAEQDQRKISNATKDRELGMNEAELIAKYGQDVVALMPLGKRLGDVSKPAPVGAASPAMPGAPSAMPGAAPGAVPGAPVPPPVVMPLVAQQQAAPPTPAVTAQPTMPTPGQAPRASDLQGMPLQSRAEIEKRRVEEADKSFNAKRDEILNYTPQLLESSNTNLKQLNEIATRRPQIFAIMQEKGLLSGLLTAAQEGAQAQAGTYTARLGLPVKDFLQRVRLEPEDQQAVRDVSRILGTEFLANVKANKGLLGVNPTDNDARLLQAPMASIDDSSKAVQLWARQQLLLNKQREALYGAYDGYTNKVGPAASPRQFFSPGSVYEKINKDYAEYRMQLFRQFNPQ
jgi:hypothetical protein